MKEKLLKNMGYFIVLLDIAIYFILSYVFVDNFQVNILSIIVNSALLFVGAIIATTAMMKQGILLGRDNQKYKDTLGAHYAQKQKIYPKLNNLQAWLDVNYLKLLRIGRSVYVNSAGYDYKEIFDNDGKRISTFKVKKPEAKKYSKWWQKPLIPILKLWRWIFNDDWHIYRERKHYVRKAKRYKITRLTVSDLININANKDPNDFGITEGQYQKRQSGMTIASRLVFSTLLQSISFGFYGFNITTFLVQMLSVVLILLSAFFAMFNAYSFMVKTHRETIIQKINKLEEYDNASKDEIEESKKRKEIELNGTHSEISIRSEGDLVEKVLREEEPGGENNLCSNSDVGV